MSSVVIVPGLHNSGPQHWQSQWQRRLPDAVRVEQAHWDRPDLQRWSAQVERVLNTVDDCWIVAHSFGCLATMHALARQFEAAGGESAFALGNVRGVFLVAPADPVKFGVVAELPAGPLPIRGRVVASLTDPWFSWHDAQQWAARWRLPVICAGDAGHINVESGHGSWWEGWNWFAQLRGEAPAVERQRMAAPQRRLALAI